MINLKTRTEYSFRSVYGHLDSIVKNTEGDSLCIVDNNPFGHVAFYKACKKHNKKPIFGLEIKVVDKFEKKKRYGNYMTFIAVDSFGLRSLYNLFKIANEKGFYYEPRITYEQAIDANQQNLVVLSGANPNMVKVDKFCNFYFEANPSSPGWNRFLKNNEDKLNWPIVATSDNYFPRPEDEQTYNILTDSKHIERMGALWICNESELKLELPRYKQDVFSASDDIAEFCNVDLSKAENVAYPGDEDLTLLCGQAMSKKGFRLNKNYWDRLNYELDLIESKNYTDYFLVVWDLIRHAKKSMLVGPGRGSSAGSLVCYLLDITTVDPIKYGLIFERFIDINREDLPDIDIDFPDIKRDGVIKYLIEKYGEDNVCHIGTISRYKARSAIGTIAKTIGVPIWETEPVKKAIVERSPGDKRANLCILDTFNDLEIGQEFAKKYPLMNTAAAVEGHASHSGVHAAGIIICNESIINYCGINPRDGVATIDKKDAEYLNLLKIDVLGLRTLSVIEQTLEQLPEVDYQTLYDLQPNDEKAFDVINKEKYSGIFQFEGQSLQGLSRQMKIETFSDIVAITSLARPGPLSSGGANLFVELRTGKKSPSYPHKSAIPYMQETYGVIVYQEQLMFLANDIGGMDWKIVSKLRKIVGKSQGEEAMNEYKELFIKGAFDKGLKRQAAYDLWSNMVTFGAYGFNKSHAVSYGLISYWCMWFKANYPLEFAVGCLNNAKDDNQGVKMLRELVTEGFEYIPVDRHKSFEKWTVADGKLIGGLINIKGVASKGAKSIISKRSTGAKFTPGQETKLSNPVTPFDDIFEGERRFSHIYENPESHGITSTHLSYIKDVHKKGYYVFLGKLKEKEQKDSNDFGNKQKKNNNKYYLSMIVEDDTDSIKCNIGRFDYARLGKKIYENDDPGTWYILAGKIRGDWRSVTVEKIKRIG